MEYRIIEGSIVHKGQVLPTYIPQVRIYRTLSRAEWVNILSESSYILKKSFQPLIQGREIDLRYIAQIFITNHKKEKDDTLHKQKTTRSN